jgi:hypothetical protein
MTEERKTWKEKALKQALYACDIALVIWVLAGVIGLFTNIFYPDSSNTAVWMISFLFLVAAHIVEYFIFAE